VPRYEIKKHDSLTPERKIR